MINVRANTNTTSSDVYKQRGWKRSDPIPEYIYDIHRSLVEEEIITHPEIIRCSKEFIRKLDPDLTNATKPRRLKRCHYVNLCPICNFLRKEYVHMKSSPFRQRLLNNGGRNLLLTFSLRHQKTHRLMTSQKILVYSIKKIKESRLFSKELFPSKHRLYIVTEYEINWSEENGYAPRCHLQVGTTNPMLTDEIQSKLVSEWRRIIGKVSSKSSIPSYAHGINVSENPSGKHSQDKDIDELKSIETMYKRTSKQKRELLRTKGSFSQTEMQYFVTEKKTTTKEFFAVLKEIYKNTPRSFRGLFFKVNSRHPFYL